MCVDPDAPDARWLGRIDRFATPGTFDTSIEQVEAICRGFRVRFGEKCQLKYLPFLPAVNFFMVNPMQRHGIVKAEVYTGIIEQPFYSRPNLVINAVSTEWREHFLKQWELYWTLSRDAFAKRERVRGPARHRSQEKSS